MLMILTASSRPIPQFIYNAFRWWEALACFVSDTNETDTDAPNHSLMANEAEPQENADDPSSPRPTLYSVDPSVGTWADLLPHIAQLATLVRRSRKSHPTTTIDAAVYALEAELLEWQPYVGDMRDVVAQERSVYTGRDLFKQIPLGGSPTFMLSVLSEYIASSEETPRTKGMEYLVMAEAYRLSLLTTLYNAYPHLLNTHLALHPSCITTENFLRNLSYSILCLLQRIDMQSSVLHMSSLPILAAGQNLSSGAQRDILRAFLKGLVDKVKIRVVDKLRDILEEVWRRMDLGCNSSWMDILEGWGSEMLIN